MCVCVRTYVCVHACVRACVRACTHTCASVCLQARMPIWVHFVMASGCMSLFEGELCVPGVFVPKFREGNRWLLSVWLSERARSGV